MSTRAALIVDIRRDLDDTVSPYLWDNDFLTGSLNSAAEETCIRTRCIADSTSALCTIAVEADTAKYALDASVLGVMRARIAGERNVLRLVNAKMLDDLEPGWDDPTHARKGTPEYAAFNLDEHCIQLYPIPAVVGDLRLSVWRLPTTAEQLVDDADVPAIPEQYHRELKHWVIYEAYSCPDAEKSDPQKAANAYAMFEARTGARPTQHAIRLWSVSRIRGTRAHFD